RSVAVAGSLSAAAAVAVVSTLGQVVSAVSGLVSCAGGRAEVGSETTDDPTESAAAAGWDGVSESSPDSTGMNNRFPAASSVPSDDSARDDAAEPPAGPADRRILLGNPSLVERACSIGAA